MDIAEIGAPLRNPAQDDIKELQRKFFASILAAADNGKLEDHFAAAVGSGKSNPVNQAAGNLDPEAAALNIDALKMKTLSRLLQAEDRGELSTMIRKSKGEDDVETLKARALELFMFASEQGQLENMIEDARKQYLPDRSNIAPGVPEPDDVPALLTEDGLSGTVPNSEDFEHGLEEFDVETLKSKAFERFMMAADAGQLDQHLSLARSATFHDAPALPQHSVPEFVNQDQSARPLEAELLRIEKASSRPQSISEVPPPASMLLSETPSAERRSKLEEPPAMIWQVDKTPNVAPMAFENAPTVHRQTSVGQDMQYSPPKTKEAGPPASQAAPPALEGRPPPASGTKMGPKVRAPVPGNRPAAMLLLEHISAYERRVSELAADVRETERKIRQRDERCVVLQQQIKSMQFEAQELDFSLRRGDEQIRAKAAGEAGCPPLIS